MYRTILHKLTINVSWYQLPLFCFGIMFTVYTQIMLDLHCSWYETDVWLTDIHTDFIIRDWEDWTPVEYIYFSVVFCMYLHFSFLGRNTWNCSWSVKFINTLFYRNKCIWYKIVFNYFQKLLLQIFLLIWAFSRIFIRYVFKWV
jgi:hypothetical protein